MGALRLMIFGITGTTSRNTSRYARPWQDHVMIFHNVFTCPLLFFTVISSIEEVAPPYNRQVTPFVLGIYTFHSVFCRGITPVAVARAKGKGRRSAICTVEIRSLFLPSLNGGVEEWPEWSAR